MLKYIFLFFALSWATVSAQGIDTLINVNVKFYAGFQKNVLDQLSLLDSVSRNLIDDNGTLLVKFNVSRLGTMNIEFISDGPKFIKTAVVKTLQSYTANELSPFYKFGNETVFVLPIKFYYKAPYKDQKFAEVLKTIPDIDAPKYDNPDYFQRVNENKDIKHGRLVYLLTPLVLHQTFVHSY